MERLIKIAYKKWRQDEARTGQAHPDEEVLACFLDGLLSAKESEEVKLHLLSCDSCARVFAIQARIALTPLKEKEVPPELTERIENLLKQEEVPLLEIFLRFKEKVIEIINTTGDILVGQELIPAPVLRSRSIKDFKDEVIILKDFQDIRVEIKIENKGAEVFDLSLVVKQKQTQKVIKDLRVTLIKDDLELESYLTDTGSVIFEHVLLGKYRLEISNLENKLASILLDIKVQPVIIMPDSHALVLEIFRQDQLLKMSLFQRSDLASTLFSGVRHYIGAMRRIEDPASLAFAKEFYAQLISGRSVGESVRLARVRLIKEYGITALHWASYLE